MEPTHKAFPAASCLLVLAMAAAAAVLLKFSENTPPPLPATQVEVSLPTDTLAAATSPAPSVTAVSRVTSTPTALRAFTPAEAEYMDVLLDAFSQCQTAVDDLELLLTKAAGEPQGDPPAPAAVRKDLQDCSRLLEEQRSVPPSFASTDELLVKAGGEFKAMAENLRDPPLAEGGQLEVVLAHLDKASQYLAQAADQMPVD